MIIDLDSRKKVIMTLYLAVRPNARLASTRSRIRLATARLMRTAQNCMRPFATNHAVLRYTIAGFFVCAKCSSSSPLRAAEIRMLMTKGILSSDGTAIAFLPFSNSIAFDPNRTKKT